MAKVRVKRVEVNHLQKTKTYHLEWEGGPGRPMPTACDHFILTGGSHGYFGAQVRDEVQESDSIIDPGVNYDYEPVSRLFDSYN